MAPQTRPDDHRPPQSAAPAPARQDTQARTAVGRAQGRHRTWLIATCAALVAAALADEATGYDGPGPFIYPAFALLVALARWRYAPLLAAAMSVFFTVGGLASRSFVHGLATPSRLLDFTAGWAQLLSFAAAAAFATSAVVCAPRTPPAASTRL